MKLHRPEPQSGKEGTAKSVSELRTVNSVEGGGETSDRPARTRTATQRKRKKEKGKVWGGEGKSENDAYRAMPDGGKDSNSNI